MELILSFFIMLTSIFIPREKPDAVYFQNSSSDRIIEFSGIKWKVRDGKGNPGGNYWSDSTESVWVDEQGVLHLTIRKVNGRWFCSEIYSLKSFGYGEYKFYITSDVENLNENIVVGLFSYLNDKNEIDIEFTKWGKPDETKTGHFVIQPASNPGNVNSFELNLSSNYSTHSFLWQPDCVKFESWQGDQPVSNGNSLIHKWEYKGNNIPDEGKEKLILNLWLYEGLIPGDGMEVEVCISGVEFREFK